MSARPALRRGAPLTPPALPARLSLVAAVDQGAQDGRLGRARTAPTSSGACPQLPPSPAAAMARGPGAASPAGRASAWRSIGSSLGGFYATVVAERRGCRAVLLNPAVDPARDLADAHRRRRRAWHGDERFVFRPEYVDELRAIDAAATLTRPRALLRGHRQGRRGADWREMSARYAGCRMRAARRQRPRAERLRRPPARGARLPRPRRRAADARRRASLPVGDASRRRGPRPRR